DLHAHVYPGGTWLGVDAEYVGNRSGTTTFVDAGSAGPSNIDGFVGHVIEPSAVRIIPFVNVSFAGLASFGTEAPECEDPRLLRPDDVLRAIGRHRDVVAGVKVRIGRSASGSAGLSPLVTALEVAAEAGLPVMCHLDEPPPQR